MSVKVYCESVCMKSVYVRECMSECETECCVCEQVYVSVWVHVHMCVCESQRTTSNIITRTLSTSFLRQTLLWPTSHKVDHTS